MGQRAKPVSRLWYCLVLFFLFQSAVYSSKVLDEVSSPGDEEHFGASRWSRYTLESDDEDLIDVSGDGSGELGEGSATPTPAVASTVVSYTVVYYRALVNFTDSIIFSEQFDDVNSDEFRDLSDAVVDTFESEYLKIPGEQMVNVVLVKKIGGDVFVELDVGSEGNSDDEQIKQVLYAVVRAGSIGSYVTSLQGLTFRRLGEVPPVKQECGAEDFVCRDGTCIPLHFRCDYRPDCRDMSDEEDCEVTETTPLITTRRPVITTLRPTTAERTTPQRFPTIIPPLRPCWTDEAVCQNEQCIPRDYLCDGERDCLDGSDELSCGTSSPCEPNEMKCRNGRCALKLWRCDGDDDCGDNSDEEYCPTKGPGDTCAPEQFTCMSTQQCIPASYHCDDEPDCLDRSDEIGCTPPQVVTPPEETIMASRGETVQFNCVAIGVPVPLITWRLNWGHIPVSGRVSMTSEGGRGTLIIRDVKEADQGAYTCEAMNAKGMVFGIPDGVLVLKQNTGPCPEGHFSIDGSTDCLPCFCFGITKICRSTGRYRNQIRLRFTEEDDFRGVNVSIPDHHEAPPLTSSQMAIVPDVEEFQLVDLSRRFLNYESFWLLPSQFLGNKIDSYGGMLRFKVRYNVGREQSDPLLKPDVIIVGNGRKLIYRVQSPTRPGVINQREVLFREGNWQYESGAPVNRDDLMMTLANVESIMIRTAYDNKMVSIGLSDISMDHTTVESTSQGPARSVEECRCPNGYRGLSCERCAPGFERVANGVLLGICAGCNCNGHASSCDPVTGYCLNCQHNTEGSQCERCKPGFFGDPRSGRTDACKPCPCPYTAPDRRFSETCFLGTDGQATCDACAVGHTGRRCERCLTGYVGNPLQPGGKCESGGQIVKCDERGIAAASSSDEICKCKPNVVGASCNQCVQGTFHLSKDNPLGCMKCFCMGVTRECASSSWRREQVHLTYDEHERERYFLTNVGHTHTISHGITMSQTSELTFRDFHSVQDDVYYWVLPDSFKGDKVTSYGGELQFTVTYRSYPGSLPLYAHPVVVLQGNGISLEHFSEIKPAIDIPTTFVVPFRESAWRRADGQPSTREHLLMALADISTLLIRASYSEAMTETRLSNLHMDVATPYSTGEDQAGEVEHCECPLGYRGPSCQDCDIGYTRVTSGLYLGTCVRCECNGHASDCDEETGECQRCQHNTEGSRCERCAAGYYGDATSGTPHDCRPCPCPGTSPTTQFSSTCFLDTDSQPTCDSCPTGFTGRRCESCLQGYVGNPIQGQPCSGGCVCDPRGSVDSLCDSAGHCICKPNVEGQNCDRCKRGHFFLSPDNTAGCLPCFCMGVTQECTSSNYYRDKIVSQFSPGNFQNFALVNRQRSSQITTGFNVEMTYEGPELSYNQFGRLGQEPYYWRLPEDYQGDKVGAYGGHLRYTLSYTAGQRGSHIADADVQITGNDITLVANHRELRPRERRTFEILFKEQYWKRPDGHPATREHLMMALADLEEILIRASYSTDMTSSSISDVSMETAIPNFTNFPLALAVEQCRCPPGYRGLSCQDCAPGYTRTGGGLYLGNCELCECNGHSESCHPESGICLNCLYHTVGDFCDRCAPGYFGDATAGTPEDCQPCGCPLTNPENMFSPTCESLGAEGYRCTACQPGYTGQHCERCAPGYTGDPTIKGQKCSPVHPERPVLSVKVYPEKTTITQGSKLVLRCQATGIPPYHFYWSREHGVPMPVHAFQRGEELHFSSVQPSDSGVYICTCRNLQIANVSRAEISVISQDKAITVTVEEPRKQKVQPGKTVNFICTAKSKSPAYTLVWTRENNRKLSNRAMDFNGILTIRNVQPEDAGIYVCTGSNMYAMDEGTAELTVTAPSKAQMFYQAYETLEGHRLPGPGVPPTVNINPPVLRVQQGYPAEFHCSVSGTPQPTLEWKRTYGAISPSAVIQRGVLRIPVVDHSDEAEYICEAQNSAGHAQASSTLYISAGAGIPPTVNINPPVVRVQQGQSAEFHCTVSGAPQPTLEWKRTYGTISPSAVIQGGVLRIPVVDRSDEAEYICEAQNSVGHAQARSALYINGANLPQVQVSPQKVEVQEGEIVKLYCRAVGSPSPVLSWKKQDGVIPSQARIERTDIGTLVIPSISAADGGIYLCVGTNAAGSSEARIEVIVIRATGTISSVTIRPSPANVREGETILLECLVTGSPQPMVIWYRERGTLSSNHQAAGSYLRIHQASAADTGEYICWANNTGGVQQASVQVSVIADVARPASPVISIEPHSVKVRLGENTSFKCLVRDGAQPVKIEWKMTQNKIMQDNVGISDNGSVISITGARNTNQGGYRCSASNPYGVTQAVVNLMVQGLPTVSVLPKGPVKVKVGDSISLECMGSGEPRPAVTWRRMDAAHKVISQSPLPVDNNAVLRIISAHLEDSGTYVCVAQNSIGSSQFPVDITVEYPISAPGIPQITIEEPELILEEGSTAVLRCFAIGTPTPTITWSKLRSPLPWQHKVVNETLIIPKVGRQDSGQYICKASNTVGFTENYISLDVESPPYATVLPDDISVRVGDAISLQCLAHGTPPITYEWTKEDGSLPSRSTVRNGILQINGATAEDAGNYKCVVKNKVGRAHTTAVVKVKSPLAVKVSPRVEVKGVGGTVQFTCSATGEPKPKIEWLKEGGDLPPNHSIRGNILRIENLQFKNQGVYICRATNKHGQVQDRATLTIQALPKVVINVRTYIQNVMVGSSVEFECLGIGDPKPTVSWSKADGQMSPDVVIQNGVLKIDQVKKSDAGYYRCTAINDVGTVKSQVILNVLTAPEIASQPETKEVLVGSTAVFTCLAKGYPVPQVSWTKLDGELPAEVVIEDFMLTIPSARPEHAGTYICTATNRQGKETVISMLKVKERVVPYFTQNPQSYLTLPTIKDAYKTFEVKITFRPDTPDGMLMYNGQKKSTGADFISFGLIGGRPEFRFDAGSGMATIRFPTPIKLGEFHTAVLNRNQTKGYIIIDDHPPVYGSSQGRFQGLDLNEELYLGGYPDYSAIYKTSGLRSGFVGCIRELVIQGREIIFNDMDLRSHRVSNCPTCRDKPCKNSGVCLDSVASSYTCKCAQGFAGTNCEHSEAQHCHPEACGPDATCVTKRDGKGYSCKCLLGKHGEKCMDGVLITSPSFNGAESFISYPPLTNIHDELRIDMKFKPLSPTGLIFYSGGKKVMADDFVSVGMIDGHLEFRYNLGSGLAVLRSIRPVSLGEWHRVSAERIQKNGTLQVDGGVEVRKSSPGKSLGLNLRTPMYLGGVPDVKLLPPATNVNIGFHGCIEEIAINGKKTDISYSFSDSRRVMQCYESTLCDNAPCQNGGRCLLTGEYEFQCLCPDGFKGERCEITEDLCASGKICANGGTCRNNKCICPVGFSGQHCETGSSKKKQLADLQLKGSGGNDSPVLYGAYLYDDGYIALPGKLFPRSKRGLPEIIELEVRTTSPSGVIFWQGVPEGESGKGKDFINLGLQDGHLVFSYQLGSGEANIVSESPVNDGVWHKVIAVREYKQGSLQVDAQEAVRGESKGSNVMVDTKGSIYLGSPPNITALTGGKYISGFTGCIRNLILLNAKLDHRPEQPIDLNVHAEAGRNARECTS